MLGEAWRQSPDLHEEACSMHRYGHAWLKPREAYLEATSTLMTNVFALRPDGNKIDTLCVPKKDLPSGYSEPMLAPGQYVRPEYLPELIRLQDEIRLARPNLVVALGNVACWALLGQTNIGQIRGAITQARTEYQHGSLPLKVLPTYHPAGVMRQWAWRPIVVADLIKAWREAQTPDISRPKRFILVSPSIDEVVNWVNVTLSGNFAYLSPDIETSSGQITMIGFARSPVEAIVIPFVDRTKPGWSYWEDEGRERLAWQCVKTLLESRLPKIFQNGAYDLQYLMRLGLRPQNCWEDTMLLHHSLFPELQKGLGFLGSVYCNEPAWKLMRQTKADTVKRDE